MIHDPINVSNFAGGALHKSGRNRIIDEDENLALIDFIVENGRLNSQGIRDNFLAFYHGAVENPPYSTVEYVDQASFYYYYFGKQLFLLTCISYTSFFIGQCKDSFINARESSPFKFSETYQ